MMKDPNAMAKAMAMMGGGGGGMPGQSVPANGANGGSGVIIIRFKTFQRLDSNFFID